MRSLPIPTDNARSTVLLCIAHVREEFASRLRSALTEIESAETNYKVQGEKGTLFEIVESASVADCIDTEEMKSLYSNTFSRKNTTSRAVYDRIMAMPKYGICPLCGHRRVSTLDHYLAKTKHPMFAITPVNLVPSCKDCNFDKSTYQPSCASEQTLHPYFDNVDDAIWLVAKVEETAPPALVFYAAPPQVWDDIKQKRVITHFEKYHLGSLYTSHAAGELQNIRYSLIQVADRGGAEGVREHLMEQATSCQFAAKNSWQSAMYEALGKSEWFCCEGYKVIAPD